MWIGIAGAVFSLVGLVVTIVQTSKAKRASELAQEAAEKVQQDMLRWQRVIDNASWEKAMETIIVNLQKNEFSVAYYKIMELKAFVCKIRVQVSNYEQKSQCDEAIQKLSKTSEVLNKKILCPSESISVDVIIDNLQNIHNFLSKGIGEIMNEFYLQKAKL